MPVLETFSQWVADQPVLVLSLMAAISIVALILAGLLRRAGQNNRRLLADYDRKARTAGAQPRRA